VGINIQYNGSLQNFHHLNGLVTRTSSLSATEVEVDTLSLGILAISGIDLCPIQEEKHFTSVRSLTFIRGWGVAQ